MNNYNYANVPRTFDRGFTGHEHITGFGLINMNGRCYDPVIGRMLSPDIAIQDEYNPQAYNRYTYCFNNPLRFTDPSGWQMIGGNKPRNPFHDDWSVSHVQPVFEPSDFRNAYHMVNQAFLGGSSMYGSPYGDYFQSGADFYKGESPSVVWFSGSLAGNYVLNPSTFNRRELVDLGVRDFTYSAWWAESGYGGYQMNLTYDFGTYSYGDDNYYYGYKGYLGAIVGGKDLSRKNYSDLGVLGEMINVGGYAGGTATLVGGAAKITGVAAGVSKAIETIGTVCSVVGGTALVINAGVNYHRYRNGDITLYSMLARDFMTLVETGIAQLPYGIGIVPSIALTAYDIGGGFEHTFYNQEWTREFFSPNYDFQQVPIYYRHGK